ncbi:peptidoglycan-binding protein [uncultured Roseobacter sp.]|uniref:peptidoglycan-binding domain-containing protein n=1 Tax=uncultured Roseobacter sp. TaxID=114847 RepID=UPI0026109C6C|nr:peptidoglycan-binding protein [uncultured Roseobacter sp.]
MTRLGFHRMAFATRVAGVFFAAMLAGALSAQEAPRIVGMVVSSERQNIRTDRALQSLTSLDAEILQATAPTNAELRALMRRFAQEARQADAALVFLDIPAVSVEGRLFVLPEDTALSRASDIYTEAVPLRAFARMTALSARGGAVLLSVAEVGPSLPAGIARAEAAPPPRSGASEILVVPAPRAAQVLDVLARQAETAARIDLRTLLERMAAVPGATLSAPPARPIVLRAPSVITPEPLPVVAPDPEQPATEEELTLLEQSLSPPVKRDLQRALRAQGHYKGLIDGIIGVQTRAAIRGFQQTRAETETGLLTPRQLMELLPRG